MAILPVPLMQEEHKFVSYGCKKCALTSGNLPLGGLAKNEVVRITGNSDMA